MRLPLLLLALAGGEPKLAVLPIDPGPLDVQSAAAIDEEVRAEARRAVGSDGLIDPARVAEALGADHVTPAEAAGKLGVAVLSGTTRRLEGALAVSLMIVSDAGRPLGTARLVGMTAAEVREDAHGKVEKLVRTALGLAAAAGSTTRSATAQPAAAVTAAAANPPGAAPAATSAAAAAAAKIGSLASAAVAAARSAIEPPPPVPAPAQPRPAAIPAESNLQGSDAALARTIREIVDQVETVRGLRRKSPLKVAIVGES